MLLGVKSGGIDLKYAEKEIIYNLSIKQYLEETLGITISHKNNYKTTCMLHLGNKDTFRYMQKTEVFKCDECGAEGDVIELHRSIISKTIKNYTREQSIEYLNRLIDVREYRDEYGKG